MSHLGRRGVVLLLVGLIWISVGYSVFHMPYPTTRVPAPHELLPPAARYIAWGVTGFIGIVSAFFAPGRDRWGFLAVMLMAAERAFSWLIVLMLHFYLYQHWLSLPVFGFLPWGLITFLHLSDILLVPIWPLALANFGAWGATCILLFAISGWKEAPAHPKGLDGDGP
jgi:hypothetical protein